MKRVMFLVLFASITMAQVDYIPKTAPGITIYWDAVHDSCNAIGYTVYIGNMSRIVNVPETQYKEFIFNLYDTTDVYVTATNSFGEGPPSDIRTIILTDSDYKLTWSINDLPIVETIQSMKAGWSEKKSGIWSKMAFDIPNKKLYLFGGLGPAFIWREFNNDKEDIYEIKFNGSTIGAIFKIALDGKFYTVSTAMSLSVTIPAGKHSLELWAYNGTVVLTGDPVITITKRDGIVPGKITGLGIRITE